MINWTEYTIYLEQIFDVINVFYTRVNYMFLPSIFWLFFLFNNSLVAPTFTFNYESLQYFLPRLIIIDFFV
jgi:hypothetical protein